MTGPTPRWHVINVSDSDAVENVGWVITDENFEWAVRKTIAEEDSIQVDIPGLLIIKRSGRRRTRFQVYFYA